MAQNPKVSYKRAPSAELLKLLIPGGDLSWLVDLGKEPFVEHQHDVHFRGNEIHVYRDGARLIRAKWLTNLRKVDISADKKYMDETCVEGFFDRHSVSYTFNKEFQGNCAIYLCGVDISSNQKGKEGAIQMKWSRLDKWPWVPFDRECRLSHQSMEYKGEVEERIAKDVDGALCELKEIYKAHDSLKGSARWAKPAISGGQIDQLVVDDEGRLVLLELKDGSNKNKGIYYAPFQLLQYIWRWHNAIEESPSLWGDLQALIDSRKNVGLTRKGAPKLAGGIRAAVGFGHDIPTAKIKERYKKVLGIVNQHLPSGVDPIETWYWSKNGPHCLSW